MDFKIKHLEEKDIVSRPNNGVYVIGLFMEGFKYNYETSLLDESELKVL